MTETTSTPTSTATPTANAYRLGNGDPFPDLTADLVGGGTLSLPGDLAGHWGIVVFNRGHWCPFCQTQLTGFERHLAQLEAIDTKVVALSVDSADDAAASVAEHHLSFPVAYGIDAHDAAARLGTYVSDGTDGHPIYTQATAFVLTPASTIAVAVYSSGAIGRLTAADAVGMITYAQSRS